MYHVVHPQQTAWNTILAGLRRAGLVFDTLPPKEWLAKLEASDHDAQTNPAIKLLVRGLSCAACDPVTLTSGFYAQPFFTARYGGASIQAGKKFSTEKAVLASPVFATCAPLTEDSIVKWVAHWRRTGFFPEV